MKNYLIVSACVVLLSEIVLAAPPKEVPFAAGYACEDITPELGILMPGYFERREMSGVLDPLEAACVALSDGTRTAFILTADNVRLSDAVVADARARITQATGVPAEAMFFHSSHIHTGGDVFPDKPACLEMHPETPADKARMRAYATLVAERLAEAAVRAQADLAPATIRIGHAQCPRHAFVRRFRMKDGSTRTNPGVGNPNIATPLGEPDDTVQVVRFVRTGHKGITVLNFQNHPDVVGGTKASADWPGVARRTLVKALDGATECLLINGALGDLNHVIVAPHPGEKLRKGYENAQHLGQMVAGAALTVWGRCDPVPAGRLSFGVKNVFTPANKGKPEDLPLAHKYWDLHCANRDAEIPDSGMNKTLLIADARRKVRLENAPDQLNLPLSALAIGDSLALAGIPGQPFVQIGRNIKRRAPFKMTIISSITNTGLGYFPTQDAFIDGGYETKTSDFTGQVATDVEEGMCTLLSGLKTTR